MVAQRASDMKNQTTSSVLYALGSVISILLFFTCFLCLVRYIRNTISRNRPESVYHVDAVPTISSQMIAETELSNVHPVTAPPSGQTQALLPINASQRGPEVQGISGYTIEVSPPYSRRVRIQSEPVVHTFCNAGEAQNIATTDQQLPLASEGSQPQETVPAHTEVQEAESSHTDDRELQAPLSSDTLSSQAVVFHNPSVTLPVD